MIILTVTDVLPTNPEVYGFKARADLHLQTLDQASWFRIPYPGKSMYLTSPIPDLGEAPMEAAILVHVHPRGPSFRPGGGQALLLPTVNLLTLCSLLLMIALEIHHQLN